MSSQLLRDTLNHITEGRVNDTRRDVVHPSLTNEPVTHSLRDKLMKAGFDVPTPKKQNRRRRRHKRNEEGKDSSPVMTNHNRTENTMSTQTQTHSTNAVPNGPGTPPSPVGNELAGTIASMRAGLEEFRNDTLRQLSTAHTQVAMKEAAIDIGKFSVKTAIGLGAFALAATFVKRKFFQAPVDVPAV